VKCYGPDGTEGITGALNVNANYGTVINAINALPECQIYDKWTLADTYERSGDK